MKKCLALVLCLMMLALPAMAEGAYLKIYDPQMYADDELVLDLAGIALEVGAGASEEEVALWAQLAAGNANLNAAAALTETDITAYLSGLAKGYKLNLADLGLDAESMTAAMESAVMPDPTEIIEKFTTAIEELQPQMDAALENATIEENVEWPMYDANHMTTKMTITMPTELLRGYFEAGYDLVIDLMEQYGETAASMGADVDITETGDIDELFAQNPYVDIEIYQANDSDELTSIAIYLIADEEILPLYIDLYTPIDGTCAYVYFPIEEDDYLEVLLDVYDDGYVYFQIAATEGDETAFDITYTKGMDEAEEFAVQEFKLSAEDMLLTVYDHNDNATEHYLEIVIAADGSEMTFELLTNPTENGASGYAAVSVDGVAIMASVEYGLTDEIVSAADADLEMVDILTMTDADMEAVGAEVETAVLTFLMDAIEEVPALGMLFGN